MSGNWISPLVGLARRVAWSREPDFVIGGAERPYIRRWWVIPRNRWFNIYLHQVLRSDDDRALHDHPWWNLSIILDGHYVEHTIAAGGINRRVVRRAGSLKLRRASDAHRLEVDAGGCWTLFLTGPTLRVWGFHCPRGWTDWRDFTNPADGGATIGRGCGETDADDAEDIAHMQARMRAGIGPA